MFADYGQIALTLLNGLGLMALAALLFGQIKRLSRPSWREQLLLGATFGIGSMAVMLSPLHLSEGVLIDGRSLFLSFAGAFGGPIACVLAGVLAIALRIGLGGVGAPVGVLGIILACLGGLIWRRLILPRRGRTWRSLALLGLLTSGSLLSTFLLPFERATSVLLQVGPFALVANVLGALVLGSFVLREMAMIEREDELRAEAEIDPLTGSLNRRSLARFYDKLSPQACALLIVDIDHFKRINDSFGHPAGDAVLREVTRILKDAVRASDVVARIGGEEFAVLLPGASLPDARRVAERIRASTEAAPLKAGGQSLALTVSIGVHCSQEPVPFEALLAEADAALYVAKNAGRNRVQISRLRVA